MRSFLVAFSALMLFASGAAEAKVAITVDKDNQQMTVAVDGVERYHWPVSTGIPSYETPNGSFRTFRMEEDHYSKEFDDAPMPHSIFFTKIGHAIHGTDSASRLGSPASHGCVRLSRTRANTAVARRDPAEQYIPQYNAAGDPVVLTPQQANPDYIYPADGSSNGSYPAPRGRRLYDAQVYQQPQYYDRGGYARQYAPQVYAPRPYYQSRGLFSYQD